MPTGQASGVPSSVIASVSSFADARRTAEYLRSYGMDAASLDIVGAGLRQATRRPRIPVVRMTATGALQGALLGVLAAVFVTLVAQTTLTSFAVVLWGFVYGLIVGTLWGLFRALFRNRPDTVTTEIHPTRYELRCPADELSVAQTLLADAADIDDGRVERGVIADARPTAEHRDAA
ncbi:MULTISPECIES: hypothetical protein [Kribbella]|uniref:Uncharacterized protein n=1 Tax=Kribbella karoonensis TaxID=324851 RepID=A0ABN2D790_9ACTN